MAFFSLKIQGLNYPCYNLPYLGLWLVDLILQLEFLPSCNFSFYHVFSIIQIFRITTVVFTIIKQDSATLNSELWMWRQWNISNFIFNTFCFQMYSFSTSPIFFVPPYFSGSWSMSMYCSKNFFTLAFSLGNNLTRLMVFSLTKGFTILYANLATFGAAQLFKKNYMLMSLYHITPIIKQQLYWSCK